MEVSLSDLTGDAFRADKRDVKVYGTEISSKNFILTSLDLDIPESKCNTVSLLKADTQTDECRSLLAVADSYVCYSVKRSLMRVIHTVSSDKALLRGHSAGVIDLKFSSCGNRNILCSVDEAGGQADGEPHIFVWEMSDNAPLTATLLRKYRLPASLVLPHPLHDSVWIIASSSSSGTVRLAQIGSTDEGAMTYESLSASFSLPGRGYISDISISTDGVYVSLALQDSMCVYEISAIAEATKMLPVVNIPACAAAALEFVGEKRLVVVNKPSMPPDATAIRLDLECSVICSQSLVSQQQLTLHLPIFPGSPTSVPPVGGAPDVSITRVSSTVTGRLFVIVSCRRSAHAIVISIDRNISSALPMYHATPLDLKAPVQSLGCNIVAGQDHHSDEQIEHLELTCYQPLQQDQAAVQQFYVPLANLSHSMPMATFSAFLAGGQAPIPAIASLPATFSSPSPASTATAANLPTPATVGAAPESMEQEQKLKEFLSLSPTPVSSEQVSALRQLLFPGTFSSGTVMITTPAVPVSLPVPPKSIHPSVISPLSTPPAEATAVVVSVGAPTRSVTTEAMPMDSLPAAILNRRESPVLPPKPSTSIPPAPVLAIPASTLAQAPVSSVPAVSLLSMIKSSRASTQPQATQPQASLSSGEKAAPTPPPSVPGPPSAAPAALVSTTNTTATTTLYNLMNKNGGNLTESKRVVTLGSSVAANHMAIVEERVDVVDTIAFSGLAFVEDKDADALFNAALAKAAATAPVASPSPSSSDSDRGSISSSTLVGHNGSDYSAVEKLVARLEADQISRSEELLGAVKECIDVSKTTTEASKKSVESSVKVAVADLEKKILQQVSLQTSQAVKKIVEVERKSLEADIKKSVESLLKSKQITDELTKSICDRLKIDLAAPLAQQVTAAIADSADNTTKKALASSFKVAFESSLLPAFQAGTDRLYAQLNQSFEAGLKNIANQTAQTVASSKASNQKLQEEVNALKTTIAVLESKLDARIETASKAQLAAITAQFEAMSAAINKLVALREGFGAAANSLRADPMELLQEGRMSDALETALEMKDVSGVMVKLLSAICAQSSPSGAVGPAATVLMSQCSVVTQLCTIQQLSADLAAATPAEGTGPRLDWLKSLVMGIMFAPPATSTPGQEKEKEGYSQVLSVVLNDLRVAETRMTSELVGGAVDPSITSSSHITDLRMLIAIMQSKY